MRDSANSDLLQAALMNDSDACRDALARGANINVQDTNGDTALHVAASWGFADFSRLLLEKGASMFVRNNFFLTPLHIAALNGKAEAFSLLLDRARKTGEPIPESVLEEIAFVCSESGTNDGKILGLLSAFRTAKNDQKSRWNRRAGALLVEACLAGDVGKAKSAISDNAPPDSKDGDGVTALRIACRRGDEEIVRLLLDNGASVARRSKTGWTPLMEACAEGHAGIAALLLEKGAPVNSKTYVHATALILAARAGHPDTVKLLLENGADPSVRIKSPASDAGKDAFKIAIEYNHEEIALLIKEYRENAQIE